MDGPEETTESGELGSEACHLLCVFSHSSQRGIWPFQHPFSSPGRVSRAEGGPSASHEFGPLGSVRSSSCYYKVLPLEFVPVLQTPLPWPGEMHSSQSFQRGEGQHTNFLVSGGITESIYYLKNRKDKNYRKQNEKANYGTILATQ